MTDLTWFYNDGGPLAVLPYSPETLWEGGDRPSAGRVVEATFRYAGDPATDYDGACDVKDVELLERAPGWILILGGVVQEAAWLPIDAQRFLLACVEVLDDSSEPGLRELYRGMEENAWTLVKHDVHVDDGGLVLMHSAGTLAEVE